MQACTQQLLCCVNIISSVFYFLLHYTEKKLCRVLSIQSTSLTVVCSSRGVWSVIFHNTTKTTFVFFPCTYRLCMPLAPYLLCTHHTNGMYTNIALFTSSQPLSVFTIVQFSILWIYAEAHSFLVVNTFPSMLNTMSLRPGFLVYFYFSSCHAVSFFFLFFFYFNFLLWRV